MELGEKIQQLREDKQWSSGKLAKEAGISRAYLWQLESGSKRSPSLHILQRMASALGVDVSDLCDAAPKRPACDGLPPGLASFVQNRAKALDIRQADVDMLAGISFRGRQPDKPEDWELLFLFLKKWAG